MTPKAQGSAAAPAAVRRALAPNTGAPKFSIRNEWSGISSEPRGRGSLRPGRARSPRSTPGRACAMLLPEP
jgi:hypothetical protein